MPRPGPLAGVPFSVKDNIEVAGWPLSLGVWKDPPVSLRTASAVQRLLDAGAELIGKTNLPPYGGGIETVNEVYGRTSNPYDLSRTVGGSSGGEAAAVASGASRFGLGTDSGAIGPAAGAFLRVGGVEADRRTSPGATASSTTSGRSAR